MERHEQRRPQLTPEFVLSAYKQGYFPMADGATGQIEFCAFEPRGIIPLDDRFRIRKSLKQVVRNSEYSVTLDQAFSDVIHACSRHGSSVDSEIWLSDEMIDLYIELHREGTAHSVEVWNVGDVNPVLIGGLYGLHLGGAFCGESMFSLQPFASQIALVALVEHLREKSFRLLDAQMSSEHLKQFGLYEVSHKEYIHLLDDALANPVAF